MKFKIIYLVYFCLAIAVISSSLAYSEIMPGGYTGAPGEGTCASCHSPANPDMDGEIRLRGIPVNVFSGATHTATVTVLDNYTDGYNAGFQLVALDASNQNAGFLSNPDASMNFSTENGRTYASHAPKKMLDYDLDPPQTSWSFDWTAPTVTENTTVTFWYTGLIENEGSELNLPLAGSKTVNIIAPVNVQLVSQNTIRCNGGNSGIATVISNSGLAPITYQWSNGQVGATLQGVGAGSYTVTATDAVGQTDHLTVTFTEPPVLSLSLEFTDLSCAGANDGFIQAFGSGGTPGYTFFWSNGQVGPNISNLSPGFYQVTMTDSNNCSLVQSTTIGAPAAIDISLQSLQPIDCAGAANGSILVSAIGGTGGLTYQWSNGLQGAQIQNLPAGNYGLTVTDANNCTATRSVEVQEPEALAIQIENLENASCFGEQDGQIITTVSGGTLPYNFSWSNEQQGQDAFNLGAGSYTLSITDANNCQTQRTFLIEQPPVLTTTILNIVPTSCFAFADGRAEAVAEGGTPPYSYAWSNGGTSALISNLPAGAYSVSISDAEGCSRVEEVLIEQPEELNLNFTEVGHALCFGSGDGFAEAVCLGGVAPYNYLWSNGRGEAANYELSAGSYTVTATDANGCEEVAQIEITEPEPLMLDFPESQDVSCFGTGDGFAEAVCLGGTPPYSFLWSDGVNTSSNYNLSGGEYTVTATDANSCEQVLSISIFEAELLELAIEQPGQLDCFGSSDGFAEAVCLGGVAPYSFLWSDGSTSNRLENIGAGEYAVTATDANGCSVEQGFVITQNDEVMIEIAEFGHAGCDGTANGFAEAVCLGGVPPYAYLWSNGAITPNIQNLEAGTYGLTVSDALGCMQTMEMEVQNSGLLALEMVNQEDVSCFGESNGFIEVNPTGGTGPYTFLWSDSSTGNSVQNLWAGHYTLTLTDATGCSLVSEFDILQPDSIQIILDSIDFVQEGSDGAIQISVSGGTGQYTYLWQGPEGFTAEEEDIDDLMPGLYSFTVSDENGCVQYLEEVEVGVSTDLEEVKQRPTLSIYPNPSNGLFTLSLNDAPSELPIRIFNVQGKKIDQTILQNGQTLINMNNFPQGIYFVVAQIDQKIISKKLILQK